MQNNRDFELENGGSGRRFKCRRPAANRAKEYFLKIEPTSSNNNIIAVVIPVYNEGYNGLFETLRSLNASLNLEKYKVIYLIVQDGWDYIAESMKRNFQKMFLSEFWNDVKDGEFKTYIFQNRDEQQNPIKAKIPGPDYEPETTLELDVALVVKQDNRKKANSHEWFFSEQGFCGFQNPLFCLATDCSTIFHPECLGLMVEVMERERDCTVCTARQVCMDSTQQREPDGLVEWMYRKAQTFDFESSFSTFMGAFAIFGFLPVVPGPCGLYRWSDMKRPQIAGNNQQAENGQQEGPLDWYFEIVNRDPETCGIILANLKIAEDRILSYSAVLKTARETTMQIQPDAEFYFEAETDLPKFVKQRRRWINGTFAGYLYLMMNFRQLVWASKMSFHRKLAVLFLILCQLGIYLIVFTTPSIFLCALYSALFWMFPIDHYSPVMPYIVWIGYVGFYIFFAIIHTFKVYVPWTFYIQMILSMFTIVCSFIGATIHFITKWRTESWYDKFPITITFVVMLAPLIISLHRLSSFWRSLRSILPFYLFLPTLVAWFGSYAVARFSDLTWGNRPGDDSEAKSSEEAKSKIEGQAHTWNGVVILLNLALILIYVQKDNSKLLIFILATLICSFSAIQMCVSTVYFLLHFLLEKFFIRSVAYLVQLFLGLVSSSKDDHPIDSAYPVNESSFLLNPSQHRKPATLSEFFQGWTVASFQLALNFCWQYLFQTVPQILLSYDEYSRVENAAFNLVFPLFGIVFLLVGLCGDKLQKKNKTFKVILVVGVLFYVLFTMVFGVLRSFLENNDAQRYWTLKAESYCQGFFLNVIGAAYLAMFLICTPTEELAHAIGLKTIMGVFGNTITSIVTLSGAATDTVSMSWTMNTLGCALLLVGMILVCCSIDYHPMEKEDKKPGQKHDYRHLGIILLTFFFFSAAMAPIQFGLRNFATDLFESSSGKQAFQFTIGSYLVQEVIVLIGGVCMVLTSEVHLKTVTILLSLSSLAQLLFFFPDVTHTVWVAFVLLAWLGLYRIVPEIYCYYWYARFVQALSDKHIGFWVASMNTTMVFAQLIGYPAIAAVTTSVDPHFCYAIGAAGIFCVFGISSAWRTRA